MEYPSSGLLANPDFVKLWIGQTISEFGSRITRDALPILAVSLLNATPIQMGWLSAATSLPVLLLGLLAGVWVDRLRRRPIMIAADCARIGLLLLIPLAFLGGWLSLPVVFLVAGGMSILGLLFETAYRALLPAIVRREHLLQANARLSTTDSLAEIGGPALTGLLVQAVGAPLAIFVDALSYLASITSLAAMRAQEPPPTPRQQDTRIWHEIIHGFATMRQDPVLQSLAVITAMRAFFGAGIGALYDLLALRELGFTPALLGLLVATGGIGALGGAALAEWLPRRLGVGTAITGALLLNGAISFCLPLAAGAPGFALFLLVLGQIAGDGAMMVYFVNKTSLQQMRTPESVLGRVNASMGFLAEGIAPIGAIIAGLIAERVGIQPTLWVIALGLLSTAIYGLASPLRRASA
ncbi:MAG: MFS transporter [Anaerolineae bacterium]|nr:MFS transporter [Anaerolineae bacterium]MCA9911366.1 MFS transporter [Anaerolineae bacterium]